MPVSDALAFDLVVVGSGPSGRAAAIQAAELGRRVAVIERSPHVGGFSLETAVRSHTMRAAVLEVTAHLSGGYAGMRAEREVTLDDLLWRADAVIEHEREAAADALRRSGVTVMHGTASFVDPHKLDVRSASTLRRVLADKIVIATGATPRRPPVIQFDGEVVVDAEGFLGVRGLPESMTVVGGGATGLEYASLGAALGIRVTLVESSARLLADVDEELVSALEYHLRGLGLVSLRGEEAIAARPRRRGGAVVHLAGGVELHSDLAVFAGGRDGAVDRLNLAAAGLRADRTGRIPVRSDYRTAQKHIFAVGDVARNGVAAPAVDQGRQAARAACWLWTTTAARVASRAISTIPEIAFAGAGERALTRAGIPYAVGVGHFRDLVRGQIAGDRSGFLKLFAHAETRQVLGVHIIGTGATELVHSGQLAIARGLTVDDLAAATHDGASLSEAYRLAACQAATRLVDDERALAA
jgi:NAD(P) transhydrogenase